VERIVTVPNVNPETEVMRQIKWLFCVALLLAVRSASAQSFSIDWYSVDGGGGTSTGGVYSLSGTIGQPDAGVHTGGPYTLVGGFWGIAIQTPGAPHLSISNSTSGIVIYWERPATDFVLDATPMLINSAPQPWTQVPFPYQTNATHIYVVVPSPTAEKFYRLRK